MTGHLSTTTIFRPEARCHGPMAVSTGQEESRWFSIVTVVRFQRVSALAGAARLTVTVSARATAMKARRMILGRFMCGGAPFGGRPSRGACVVGVRVWLEAGEQEAERGPEDESEQEGQKPGGRRHVFRPPPGRSASRANWAEPE